MGLTRISGDVVQTPLNVGVVTATTINVGTAVTIHTGGFRVGSSDLHSSGLTVQNLNSTGVVTATSFRGDGSALTGIAATTNVRTNSLVVSGVTTATGGLLVGTGASISSPATNVLTLGTNNSERVRIGSTGNVGVGTNFAQTKLDVRGELSVSDGIVNFLRGDTTYPKISINGSSANDTTGDVIISGYYPIIFKTDMGSERMRISRDGNIGINSTSPSSKLDINPGGNSFFKFGQDSDNPKIEIFRSTGTLPYSHYGIKIQQVLQDLVISTAGAAALGSHSFSERLRIDSSGHTLPGADNTYDLGSSSKRWRNVFTTDLQLSNEGSQNDVDGTWGKWTLQEGEDDIFLINRRNGKKYKINLTEVN